MWPKKSRSTFYTETQPKNLKKEDFQNTNKNYSISVKDERRVFDKKSRRRKFSGGSTKEDRLNEEQFVLGDEHNFLKLINSAEESFELHGHRKPSAPSFPQPKEASFETIIDELIDQAAIVNHHGTILAEQSFSHRFSY
ncbi:unnamed protein product [Caenorhabditis brenneri]